MGMGKYEDYRRDYTITSYEYGTILYDFIPVIYPLLLLPHTRTSTVPLLLIHTVHRICNSITRTVPRRIHRIFQSTVRVLYEYEDTDGDY